MTCPCMTSCTSFSRQTFVETCQVNQFGFGPYVCVMLVCVGWFRDVPDFRRAGAWLPWARMPL